MPGPITRILSDVHYGDRASRVTDLAQLRRLVSDTDAVVFNGDTLDTRPGPNPRHTARCRDDVAAFEQASGVPMTFLTGNHDPDVSLRHSLDLGSDQVFVVHGDVLFDNIVPWGRDARVIRAMIGQATGVKDAAQLDRLSLDERLAVWRRVAATIPQRHQSERDWLKYALSFAVDTVWPPTRFLEIFRAWHREPRLASALVRRVRPRARYVILGHTHRPAIRRGADGLVVINTGSFTAPFGGYAVDLSARSLTVRRVTSTAGAFFAGAVVAEFPLH